MSDRNRPAIAVILPTDDPWLADDPRTRDAQLEQQLVHLERIAQRARRRAAGSRAADGRTAGADDDDGEAEEDESELKPPNGRFC